MTRPPVLLPPKGWRPPALTGTVKGNVIIRQRAMCGCDECVRKADGRPDEWGRPPHPAYEAPSPLRDMTLTRFDHRPPVHEREWLPHLDDTSPSANDPKFVRAVDVDHDQPVTVADVKRMRKVNRIRDDEAAHADYVATKVPGQKRGRQSRSFR